MPTQLTPAEAVAEVKARAAGGRVFLTTGPAEPLVLHEAWKDAPEAAAGLTFCGLFIPGVNRLDYSTLHPDARMQVFMLSPDWRQGFENGRVLLRARHYSDSFQTLITDGARVGVFQVGVPDAQGACTLGPAADSGPAMLSRVDWRLGVLNRAVPSCLNAPRLPLAEFDAIVECDHPLAELAASGPPGSIAEKIAAHVAAIIPDGAMIQTGIGKLPLAATAALREKKGLRIHSGLIAAPHLELLEARAIADAADAVVTGIAVGDRAFYAAISAERRIRFAPVSETHAHSVIAAYPQFFAINAALEIDLLGQINAESAGGRQISGTGGLVDFVRGAKASRGGKAIVMIQAEGKDASRIIPMLKGPVTIPRSDAPVLVTEHGAVDLAPLDLDARAHAIIELAGPTHRDALAAAWRVYRAGC